MKEGRLVPRRWLVDVDHLDAVDFRDPAFPVISNVTAAPVNDALEARTLLVQQLTSAVRWTHCVRAMLGLGVTQFIEVGTGKVLTGMLKRIDPEASGRGIAVGSAADVEAFLERSAA